MLRRAAALVIVPVLIMAWSFFGAQNLTTYSFHALMDYASPYLGALPSGKDAVPVSKQVVIVVVDALRADTSRTMNALNALRARGADRNAQVGQPSLSLPGWTVIGTGAWQEQSGVTLNFYTQDIKIDTIFEAAKRKGLTTAIVGAGSGWKQLYARGVDWNQGIDGPQDPYNDLPGVRRQDDQIEAAALKILANQKPNLLLVHFAEPDDAGHAHGAASAEYRDAAQAIDARIGHIAAAVDLSQADIIVTGDHGMLDVGGHGGWEPEVMTVGMVSAGKGIIPGKYSEAVQADIAPTLAVLLGTSIPAHNQGTPLFDMIDMSTPLRAQRALDTAVQIGQRYDQMGKVLGTALPFTHGRLDAAKQALSSGDAESAYKAALDDIKSSADQFAAAKNARLNQDRIGRIPTALLVLIPFIIYAVVMARAKWNWRVPVIGGVAYFLVYNLLFFGRGYTFSLSIFNSEEQILSFFTARTMDAMLALIVATIVVGVASRGSRAYDVILNTINMAFVVVFALAIQIDLFYLLWNATFAWYLPDLAWGFKYYLDVLQTGAFYPLVYLPILVILMLISVAAAWITSRIAGVRASRTAAP